jgi:carboxymethylenebutenolidase
MASQEIIANEVRFPGKACELLAYVAQRAGCGTAELPAVIVVQEWWGLDEHIRDVARRVAREGYLAVAPDLYSRQGHKATSDPNVAGKLMEGLAQADGMDDLVSTVGWIKSQTVAKSSRIGVIGFCMGGSYAAMLPCVSKDIKAAVPFYGEVPPDEKLRDLNCPMLYIYDENDGWITRKDVDRLADAFKKSKKQGEVKIFAGTSHGFFNNTRKDVYNAEAAKDAWQRTLRFFEQHLKR